MKKPRSWIKPKPVEFFVKTAHEQEANAKDLDMIEKLYRAFAVDNNRRV